MPAIQQKSYVPCADCLDQFHHTQLGANETKAVSCPGKANQRQALEYALKYGFDSITPNLSEFGNKSAAQIREWVQTMKEKGVRYGTSGLPVQFRRDEDRFQRSLTQLPKQASVLKQLGVRRVATWIPPGHNELTYLQNFEQHKRRLREVAKVLKDYDIRLGLEFVRLTACGI